MIGLYSYLRWVGVREYQNSEDFVQEVVANGGVFSALPSLRLAQFITANRSVIFLAHADRSSFRSCPACLITSQCPLCSAEPSEKCPRCRGLGEVEERTGGAIEVDGARWSYLRYRGLRKNPAHEFWRSPHKIGAATPCYTCGGRGVVPVGKILGFYVPNRVVVVTDLKNGLLAAKADEYGHPKIPLGELRTTRPRKGEADWKAGVYAVTVVDEAVTDLVCELTQTIGRQVSIEGGLVLFKEPTLYQGKFFMGIKKWSYPGLE